MKKGTPVFKDGETPYETNTIRYNFKSKKGIISNVVSQQGEGYVTGNNAKKGANDELYMKSGRYTTCLSGGGGCAFAACRAVLFLPVFEQLFVGFPHAYLYG